MARVLVTGASGLLGRGVMKVLASDVDLSVLGLYFSHPEPGLRRCDLLNEEEMKAVMNDFQPNWIIHCAAERKPDVVEKKLEETRSLNVTATARLCQLADACGASVLYISTDYVFDGTSPPYKVTDKPNPLNAYGLSKLDGEIEVLKYKKNVSLRVPVLYGEVKALDESAVTILFSKVADSSRPAEMDNYGIRFPTHCSDIGQVILNFLRLPKEKQPRGILHWSGSERMTKFDMAIVIAEVMGKSKEHIIAVSVPPPGLARPKDSQLDRSLLEELGCGCERNFRLGIAECLAPFAK